MKKIILIGPSESGKTSFIKAHLTGEFLKEYTRTDKVEVYPFSFEGVSLMLWDCSSSSSIQDVYYLNADACIAFFDLTSPISSKYTKELINNVKKICPNIPIILCGNKHDSVNARICPPFVKSFGDIYYDNSVKSRYNIDKPFKTLIKNDFLKK